MCLPPAARIFSGPHPVAQQTSLGAGASQQPVVEVVPKRTSQVHFATPFPKSALSKDVPFRKSADQPTSWLQEPGLQSSKSFFALSLPQISGSLFQARAPVTDEAANGAAKRIQAAARRRKLFLQEVLCMQAGLVRTRARYGVRFAGFHLRPPSVPVGARIAMEAEGFEIFGTSAVDPSSGSSDPRIGPPCSAL